MNHINISNHDDYNYPRSQATATTATNTTRFHDLTRQRPCHHHNQPDHHNDYDHHDFYDLQGANYDYDDHDFTFTSTGHLRDQIRLHVHSSPVNDHDHCHVTTSTFMSLGDVLSSINDDAMTPVAASVR